MARLGNIRFALSISKGGRACRSCFGKRRMTSAMGDARQ
jgi:hypothetical protein